MEKERLKLIVKNLELLVDSLKAEVYSDTDAYIDKRENFDEEGLKFSKLLPVPLELDDELYIQTWKIENWGTRNELDKKGFEYLREEDNTFSFETFMYPPLLWVTKAAEKYPKISFILTFSQSVHNFSGFVTYKKGKCIAQKIGKDGDHYGRKNCEYCDKYINYDKAKEECGFMPRILGRENAKQKCVCRLNVGC